MPISPHHLDFSPLAGLLSILSTDAHLKDGPVVTAASRSVRCIQSSRR